MEQYGGILALPDSLDSCPVSGYGVTFLRRNHLCSLAACTTSNESGKCVHCRHWICGSDQRWIPAFAGMTIRGFVVYFHTNDGLGAVLHELQVVGTDHHELPTNAMESGNSFGHWGVSFDAVGVRRGPGCEWHSFFRRR